jgi:Domain of unknown function (DUF222)/HNH endonuclease
VAEEVAKVCTAEPVPVTDALAMLDRALDSLNGTDVATLPTDTQAFVLRGLERAEAKHTAARAKTLAAFAAQDGYEADGHGGARVWLRWQTRVTKGAAAGAVGWARRLAAHPVIAAALASGELSASWGKDLCAWTDRLPPAARADADEILTGAARAGADHADLAGLAQEMFERTRQPDTDRDGGFEERGVWLETTLDGAGHLRGDLSPGCSAALAAVLEALGRRAGKEDLRTVGQRRHDALAEACQRLLAGGLLPGTGGQPARAQLHLTLSQLRGLPGAAAAEAAWAAARAGDPGWLSGPEAAAAACDTAVAPVVTGHVDPAALDRLTTVVLAAHGHHPGATCRCTCGGCPCPTRQPPSPATRARLGRALLGLCADVLSGPGGLAAWLRRTQLTGAAASPSQPLYLPIPLDAGKAEPDIPPPLRRAVLARHRHCAFAGCRRPARHCHLHHLIPRSQGGPTALSNLAPVCEFHHLVAIHTWGWTLRLNPDGTTTATSPDRTRHLHSHDPPSHAAA